MNFAVLIRMAGPSEPLTSSAIPDLKSLACGRVKRFVRRQPAGGAHMVKTSIVQLARFAPAIAMLSCAAPKATVVDQPAAPKKDEPAPTDVPVPVLPDQPNDGIRIPDMLGMPGDNEFRATNTSAPKPTPEPGAVIARPPLEPPSRPKSKDKEKPAGGQ
jgi:hypothetical protein